MIQQISNYFKLQNYYESQCKCVSYVDCGLNTNAVTNRECLISNSTFCRFNYTKGQGCAFMNCDQITNSEICSVSEHQNLLQFSATHQWLKCDWDFSKCIALFCQDYQIQSDCENNYDYGGLKCNWCLLYSTPCSYNPSCNLSNMPTSRPHQDFQGRYVFQTINFIMSSKCTKQIIIMLRLQILRGLRQYDRWYRLLLVFQCLYMVLRSCSQLISTYTHSSCHSWKDSYMSLDNLGCQPLDCSQLIIMAYCTIFTIGKYTNGFLCLDTSNSQGIPCFWDGTKCLEKTCSNKPTPSISQADCNSWLIKCQYNKNCTQADISNKTHELCESYYLNISCNVKLDIIQCVDLPIACFLAKKLNVIKINLEMNASIQNQKVVCQFKIFNLIIYYT
ncbi:unnamed protein product [Paramecium octaurelia]|uniref:Uncharacterized protein n=1 Tax=Paramecium octaurelia TaxID=43137 RepID=A0A8S1WF52_PAROT|nr:unnamed protein product [Paramecium octaurelia]